MENFNKLLLFLHQPNNFFLCLQISMFRFQQFDYGVHVSVRYIFPDLVTPSLLLVSFH